MASLTYPQDAPAIESIVRKNIPVGAEIVPDPNTGSTFWTMKDTNEKVAGGDVMVKFEELYTIFHFHNGETITDSEIVANLKQHLQKGRKTNI